MAEYTMLIASLPYIPPLFTVTQTPLSRLKLDQRLRNLKEDDALMLNSIEEVLQWERLPMDQSDAQLVHRVRKVMAGLDNELLEQLVRDRLEIRTVIAALRRRRRGESAPQGYDWGYGRWLQHIQRNWTESNFRLENAFPWISEARSLLEADDSLGLERLLLQTAWNVMGNASEGHYFDFEAVVIYVLRWDLVARWTTYDETVAADRFEALVEEALGDHTSLYH